MNANEFDSWLMMHRSRFRFVDEMLSEDPTIGRDWFTHLGRFNLTDAEAATVEMMAMDPPPYAGQ